MTTRKDLRHNQRVPGSLEVTVYDIKGDPVPPREVELKATDTEGKELEVVIWEKHDVSGDWTIGSTYEISGGRAKRYKGTSGPDVVVDSNDDFSIDCLDNFSNSTQVLIVGDTHVGFRHRQATKKPSWAKKVDNRKTISQSLARARDLDVNAVIHAGDVFDHNTNQGDRNHVGQEIHRTHEAGIPVYFVRGNHDNQAGNRTLSQTPAVHIAGDTVSIDQESVQVSGLDYGGGEFSEPPPDGAVESVLNPSILVVHDTPYPAVDEDDVPIYRNDANRLDLTGFLDSAAGWLDLIVAGHMHVGKRGSMEGYDVPLLVTGPTGTISAYDEDSQPSTWLLTISDGEIDVDRQPL